MSDFGVSLVSFGCGFLACWILLVRPARNLLIRWLDYYADDIDAAEKRQAKRKTRPLCPVDQEEAT